MNWHKYIADVFVCFISVFIYSKYDITSSCVIKYLIIDWDKNNYVKQSIIIYRQLIY